MISKIGFRMNGDIVRSDKGLLARLKEIGTCSISDAMNGFNTMHPSIKPIYEETRIAGNAITVRMRSADNLMLHKAIQMAEEGDIIVVDTYGADMNSIIGEMMTFTAIKKGVAGIIIDGAVRDILELKKMRAPIFAKAVTPSLGSRRGPGEINYTISCGGVTVNPGDIIVGDANGVVVVDPMMADEILKIAEEKVAFDEQWYQEILKGNTIRSDVEEYLRQNGLL